MVRQNEFIQRDRRENPPALNATPLGMKPGDPLPVDVSKITPETFVGKVVMEEQFTPLLRAAMEKGCTVQSAQTCCSR